MLTEGMVRLWRYIFVEFEADAFEFAAPVFQNRIYFEVVYINSGRVGAGPKLKFSFRRNFSYF